MSALCQFPQQQIQDVPNLALERAERWNNGLRLPLHNVAQNYNRGKLHILVKMFGDIDGERYGWVLCIEKRDSVETWASKVKSRECHGWLPMLGFPVQVVDEPENVTERVASVVRLYAFDDLLRSVAREYLYFSFKTGRTIFVETLAEDGKKEMLKRVPILNFLAASEQPSYVIERRPEMVENLPGQDGQTQRNPALGMVVGFCMSTSKTFITDDWCSSFR